AGRTADQTRGVRTLIAGVRYHPVPIVVAFADEAGRAAVRARARAHAVIAARAEIHVDEHHALAMNEPGVHCHLQILRGEGIAHPGAAFRQPVDALAPELLSDRRRGANDVLERLAPDAHEFDVLERLERERPRLVEQQRDLAGVVALAQISDREIARA